MKNIIQFSIKTVFVILALTFLNSADARIACSNRLSGTYDFGVAPDFCNVNAFNSATDVKSQYAPVIYNDLGADERATYMSHVFPAYRDLVKYYIRRRNPSVSAAEVEGFLAGTYTLATQESVWSHFRVGRDHIVRFMRGDSLHGYGFMQLDDRSHASQIKKGIGEDMVENMLAGLDIYYAAWVQSKTARCIKSSSDYKSRARAAWAAYNAGPNSICRWTRRNSHDVSYLNNYNNRHWTSYVKDVSAASPIDVVCLAEGKRPCALPGHSLVPTQAVAPLFVAAKPSLGTATLIAKSSYRVLRECAEISCAHVAGAIQAGEKLSVVSAPFGEWIEVASLKDGHGGWLKVSDLEDLH